MSENDEELAADLKVALEEEYQQQPSYLHTEININGRCRNTGKIIIQDVIQKKNLQKKLVELRNQIDYITSKPCCILS